MCKRDAHNFVRTGKGHRSPRFQGLMLPPEAESYSQTPLHRRSYSDQP